MGIFNPSGSGLGNQLGATGDDGKGNEKSDGDSELSDENGLNQLGTDGEATGGSYPNAVPRERAGVSGPTNTAPGQPDLVKSTLPLAARLKIKKVSAVCKSPDAQLVKVDVKAELQVCGNGQCYPSPYLNTVRAVDLKTDTYIDTQTSADETGKIHLTIQTGPHLPVKFFLMPSGFISTHLNEPMPCANGACYIPPEAYWDFSYHGKKDLMLCLTEDPFACVRKLSELNLDIDWDEAPECPGYVHIDPS